MSAKNEVGTYVLKTARRRFEGVVLQFRMNYRQIDIGKTPTEATVAPR